MDTENNSKMVGGFIPDRLFQVINLHTITHKATKSQIVRDALLLWIERNNVDINGLLQELFAKYEAEWLRLKNEKGEEISKEEYKSDLRLRLDAKNVSPQLIERLLKRL